MKLPNRVEFTIGIFVCMLGIAATIVQPWPAEWIAKRLSVNPFLAKLIVVACVVFIVFFVGAIIVWICTKAQKEQNDSDGVVYKDVPATLVCDCLLQTLLAFEAGLAARCRELRSEHNLTRKNQLYHGKRLRKLAEMNLLDCEIPWLLRSLADTNWRTHLASRQQIETKLVEVCRLLRKRLVRPRYVIALASDEAEVLLKDVRKQINELKKIKPPGGGT